MPNTVALNMKASGTWGIGVLWRGVRLWFSRDLALFGLQDGFLHTYSLERVKSFGRICQVDSIVNIDFNQERLLLTGSTDTLIKQHEALRSSSRAILVN